MPVATSAADLAHQVEVLARRHGLDAVGIAPAKPLVRARAALETRKAAGLHAGMAFTYRNPARATTPEGLVAGAQAIVVGARRYGSIPPAPVGTGPQGRVARYAWTDHYEPLRDALRAVGRHLRSQGHRAVVFADDNGLVDREAAYQAGIGWFGKNANLLLGGGQGSWFVLGCVVTTAPLPPTREVAADGCGACRRCLDRCPTAAIVAPGVVDANRCLAWLVQKPGSFAREHREALADRIYGCDDCQEVCPPNVRLDRAGGAAGSHTAAVADAAVAGADDAVADDAAAGADAWVPLLELLEADDESILARYGRWYIAGRDPRWLRRNALLALGNTAGRHDPAVGATLRRYLGDDDPMLRAHALWACRRLGRYDLAALAVADGSPEVQAELAAPSPTVRGSR